MENSEVRCFDCRFIPETGTPEEGWSILKIEVVKDGVIVEVQKRCLCPTCYSNRKQFAKFQRGAP